MARYIIGFVFLGLAALMASGAWLIYREGEKPPAIQAQWLKELPGAQLLKDRSKRAVRKRSKPVRRPYLSDLLTPEMMSPFVEIINGVPKYGYNKNLGRGPRGKREIELVIPPIFDGAVNFYRVDFARVKLNGKYGLINRKGDFVVEPHFDWISRRFLQNGTSAMLNGRRFKLFSSGKKQELPPLGRETRMLWGGVLAVKKGEQWGIFSFDGKEFTRERFDERFDEIGLVPVMPAKAMWSWFHKQNGKLHMNTKIPVYNPAVRVRQGDKWGYVFPSKGQLSTIDPLFEQAENFNGAPAVVKLDGKYGLLDFTGQWFIPPRFDEPLKVAAVNLVDKTYRGLLPIKVGKFWGLADRTGEFVSRPEFDEIGCWKSGERPTVRKGDKWGIINQNGVLLADIRFDKIACFEPDACFTTVRQGGDSYRIDRSGRGVADDAVDRQRNKCVKRLDTHKLPGSRLRLHLPPSRFFNTRLNRRRTGRF